MHAYTGKLHRLKKKNLYAVINIKLNLHCFTKLPSLQYQAKVCVESAIWVKPCETDEAHTTKEKRCHYVWPVWGACFFIVLFLYANSEACAVTISRERCPRSNSKRKGQKAISSKTTLLLWYTWNKLLSPTTSKSMELACPHEFVTGMHIVNKQQTRKQYTEVTDSI